MNVRRSRIRGLVCALLAAAAGLGSSATFAVATVDSYTVDCRTFSATGTSDSPYVTFYVYDRVSSAEFFEVVPVVGGSFSHNLDIAPYNTSGDLNLEVWGSLNPYVALGDPGYWDGGAYFNVDASAACSAVEIPTLDPAGTVGLGALLALAGLILVRRRARA